MNTESDRNEVRENSTTTAVNADIAAQAWDRTQRVSTSRQSNDSTQTHIDYGSNDIYNTARGNAELKSGNRDLQNAENDIDQTVNQIIDGNYDTDKLVQQMETSWNHMYDATDEYRGAIKHLGATSSAQDTRDMLTGRREVYSSLGNISTAEDQLKSGDEAGALKSLLNTLGNIDDAQKQFADVKGNGHGQTGDCPPGSNQDGTQGGGQNTPPERFIPHFGRGLRPIAEGDYSGDENDGRMYPGGSGTFDQSGHRNNDMWNGYNGNFYRTSFNSTENNYNSQNDSNSRQSDQFDPLNPISVNNYIYNHLFNNGNNGNGYDYNSNSQNGDNGYSIGQGQLQIQIPSISQLNQVGDQVSNVVDPLHILPKPSDFSDPVKLTKKILWPF